MGYKHGFVVHNVVLDGSCTWCTQSFFCAEKRGGVRIVGQPAEVMLNAWQIFQRVYRHGCVSGTKARALVLVSLLYSSRLLHGSNRENEAYLLKQLVTPTRIMPMWWFGTPHGSESSVHTDGCGRPAGRHVGSKRLNSEAAMGRLNCGRVKDRLAAGVVATLSAGTDATGSGITGSTTSDRCQQSGRF